MKKYAMILTLLFSTTVSSETVNVKFRGEVDLEPFECEWVAQSPVVRRLCYDPVENYVIVNLSGIYHHYCEVPPVVITAWRQADSKEDFYIERVNGIFECRVVYRVPPYK